MKKYQIEGGTSITVYQDFGLIRSSCSGVVIGDLILTENDLVGITEHECKDPDCGKKHNCYIFKIPKYEDGQFMIFEEDIYIIESVQNTPKNTPSETLVNTGSDLSDFTVH